MLTRWSIPEPVPAQVIAPEYNKAHRIKNGDQLPARPGSLCILGPDYSCVNNMLHEHWMYGSLDEDILDARLLEAERKKQEREVIAEAKRQKRRDDTIERSKISKLLQEERAKQNKIKGFKKKPSVQKIS